MDLDTGIMLTGGFFAELFNVPDGWAHFDANFANEEGEVNKANFDKVVCDESHLWKKRVLFRVLGVLRHECIL